MHFAKGEHAMREAGPREARPHSVRVAGLLLLATTAFVPSGSPFAGTVSQPVPGFLAAHSSIMGAISVALNCASTEEAAGRALTLSG